MPSGESASTTAFATAAVEAIVPASPTPLTPIGLTGDVALVRYIAVDDVGNKINPMIVEGQLHGGIAQGLGSALGESLIYDETGQLLTGTLMDYPLPRADEMPPLEVIHMDFPSAINALGIKGVGESGVISPAAAVANAVEDALADFGIELDRPPVTAARVFELLRASGRWPIE